MKTRLLRCHSGYNHSQEDGSFPVLEPSTPSHRSPSPMRRVMCNIKALNCANHSGKSLQEEKDGVFGDAGHAQEESHDTEAPVQNEQQLLHADEAPAQEAQQEAPAQQETPKPSMTTMDRQARVDDMVQKVVTQNDASPKQTITTTRSRDASPLKLEAYYEDLALPESSASKATTQQEETRAVPTVQLHCSGGGRWSHEEQDKNDTTTRQVESNNHNATHRIVSDTSQRPQDKQSSIVVVPPTSIPQKQDVLALALQDINFFFLEPTKEPASKQQQQLPPRPFFWRSHPGFV